MKAAHWVTIIGGVEMSIGASYQIWPTLMPEYLAYLALALGAVTTLFGFSRLWGQRQAEVTENSGQQTSLEHVSAGRDISVQNVQVRQENGTSILATGLSNIKVGVRISAQYAEIYVGNKENVQFTDVSVVVRNTRRYDGACIEDVLKTLVSRDGRQCPLNINPGETLYFQLACPDLRDDNHPQIWLLPNNENYWLIEGSVVVKVGVSAKQFSEQTKFVLLCLDDSNQICAKPWTKND